jgi:circadian clock protein KaiC
MGLATVKTDIAGFDALLGGGIPKGSTVLISGPPGAGKTVTALQYTFNQARKGERVLFVSTCELLYSLNKFGSTMSFFDLGLVRTGVNLDFYGPREEAGFVEFWDYSLASPGEGDIFEAVQDKVSAHRIDHLVIDSISSIHLLLGDSVEHRKKVLLFMGWASRSGCTTVLTAECDGMERLLADCIVDMGREEADGMTLKTIRVVKLRGQEHCRGRYLYNISKDGITVLSPGTGMIEGEMAKTGIPDLDDNISGMPYGSAWHFNVHDEALYRPLMDAMIREAFASGDCLVYIVSPTDDLSLDAFRERFGPEDKLKGSLAIMDPYGLQVPDKLKEFVITAGMGGHDWAAALSKPRFTKGIRCRMIADAGIMEKTLGVSEARKTLEFALGRAREKCEILIVFNGPASGGPLSVDISARSDAVVDVRDYGGYALLQVRKAPYAKSFEPFVARLEDGEIRLKPL